MHIDSPARAKTVFHPLTVAEIRRETASAVSIRFDVPADLAPVFAFQAGQYLTLKADIDGEDVRRNYSICASPLDGELRVAVKALTGGKFSGFANEILRAGHMLEVIPANGHFTAPFAPDRAFSYAAFAAGSGITPILAIIKTALMTEPNSRFSLVYGNRRSGEILFLEELAGLKNRFMDRLEIFHFLSMEVEEIEFFNGRLDAEKCGEILRRLIDPGAIERFFVCGPEGMMQAAEDALLAAGVPGEKILLERFLSAGPTAAQSAAAAAAAQAAAGQRMGVVLDGRRSTVTFDAALGNILDSVRAAGMAAPFACKGGVCATCRAKLVSGTVEMAVNYGLTSEEVAQGYILTCQAAPTGEDVVLSYDI
jgi:ring-1,2-phenylacetyl-CoA epoxidase subunit PaaE